MNVMCNKEEAATQKKDGSIFKTKIDYGTQVTLNTVNKDTEKCLTEIDFYGYEGCELVDLTTLLAPIAYASGFVQIVMGFFLLSCGNNMIDWSIKLLMFITTSCGGFMVLYNLGLVPGLDQGKTTVMIAVGCVCGVLGFIATYFLHRILHKG